MNVGSSNGAHRSSDVGTPVHCRVDSGLALSQWETLLHCNGGSDWLGALLESIVTYGWHQVILSNRFFYFCNLMYQKVHFEKTAVKAKKR